MTESKKKTTRKEVVNKNEDVVKPVKKAKVKETKVKETKEKLIEQALEEEILHVEEEVAVEAKASKNAEETLTPAEPETIEPVPDETEEVSEEIKKEKRPKKVKAGPEAEIEIKTESAGKPSAEEFDWDAFETEEQKASPRYKEYEALYDETLSTVAVDEVVPGTVIQMTLREVVINIGYKSEGVVSLNEFRYNPNLKIGDTVEVYVESQEEKKGQLPFHSKKDPRIKLRTADK